MLFCISASHKSAEFATLERLSTGGDASCARALAALPGVRGAVVVSTCNRYEAYLDLEPEPEGAWISAVASAVDEIADAAGLNPRELRSSLAFKAGPSAVRHLFAVASGLESMVVGEDEISGQVKRSLDHAQRDGVATPELATLFQRALEASRAVKTAAGRGAANRSVVGVALEMASSRIREWGHARVLVVGTGSYATAAVAALRARGVQDLRAHSVSNGGASFAQRTGIPLVPRADFAREAALADVVVTCTTARQHVLSAQTLASGRGELSPDSRASGRRLRLATSERTTAPATSLIIDLGLPRNVNPDVAELPGVSLIDLETIRVHASIDELATMDVAQSVVGAASKRFSSSSRVREVAPALVALRKHILDLVDAEVARAERRSGYSEATEEALRHLAGVLLHQPLARSRELADEGRSEAWLDGLDALFGIDVRPSSEASLDLPLGRDATA